MKSSFWLLIILPIPNPIIKLLNIRIKLFKTRPIIDNPKIQINNRVPVLFKKLFKKLLK